VPLETSTALQRLLNIAFRKFSAKLDTAFIVPHKELYGIILHLRNIRFPEIIPLGGKQTNRILAVAILVGMIGCSVTQPYVTNISPRLSS